MQPDEIIRRVWPGRDVDVEPLGGGITDNNLKVEVGGETVVLRVGGKDTELLDIDRLAEHEAALAAAAVGVGSSQLDFDFIAYADEHFERLARTAASPSFRQALETLGAAR